MRKIIIIFACLIILIPVNLNAVAVQGASVTGQNEVTIGEEYTLKVHPNISGFTPGYDNKIGYLLVYIEILYDEDVLSLQKASIPYFEIDFNSDNAIQGKGHRLILAAFSDEEAPNLCAYDSLYCGDITLDLKFFAKNTKVSSTNIEIRNITIGYLDLSTITEEELNNLDESELLEYLIKQIQTTYKDVKVSTEVNIKNNNSNTPIEEPTTTPPSSNPDILNPNINVPKVENNPATIEKETKSSNSYLSKLEIQNYKIDFNKDIKEYEITVGAEVNKIIVSVEAEDPKALARVKGNDDLNANGNKVTIEVLAEDNSTSTYTINILHRDKEELDISEITKKEKNIINVDKKIFKLMIGILSGIILIVIIIFLSTINKRRKLNKLFKEL